MNVEIVEFPETKVAVVEHLGSPSRERESAMKLIAWRKENKMPPQNHKSYGVHYDNPLTTPPEEYRVDFCVSVQEEIGPNEYGVVNKIIPGGRCAVTRHIGSRNNIPVAAYLYEKWLPESGEELREYPIFFHYVNVGPQVAEEVMITDIYLPIRDKQD